MEEKIFKGLMIMSLALVLVMLAGIIVITVYKGAPALTLSMLIETPKGGYYLGKEGGIANAIVGSLFLALGASFCSILIAIPVAFGLQKEYTGWRFASFTKLVLDVLWGIPSIVYGAFGFVVMVYFGLRASLLGGIIVLTLLMLPIMVRSMEEVIRTIPLELKEISYALGATNWRRPFQLSSGKPFPALSPQFSLPLEEVSGTLHRSFSRLAILTISLSPFLTRSPLFPLQSFSRSGHQSLKSRKGLMHLLSFFFSLSSW